VACGATATAVDNYNCNYGNTFISGLRAEGAGPQHYDDVVRYASGYINMLWDFTGGTNDDIHNLNIGNVGVGTLTAHPAAALELKNNTLWVTPSTVCDTNTGQCWKPAPDAPQVCDLNSKCWHPEYIGGYDNIDATDSANPTAYANNLPSGNNCPLTG